MSWGATVKLHMVELHRAAPCISIPSHSSVAHDPPMAPPSHCCFSQEGEWGATSILILVSRGENCSESPSIPMLSGTSMLLFLMKLAVSPQRKGGERAGCVGSESIFSGTGATPHAQNHGFAPELTAGSPRLLSYLETGDGCTYRAHSLQAGEGSDSSLPCLEQVL